MSKASLQDRFWPKVDKRGPGDCWLWTASTDNRGYGKIWCAGRTLVAHRVSYEWANGPIQPGHELDHLCRTRSCVNPSHLEAVTHRENIQRGDTGKARAAQQLAKTHCPRGHPYSGENLLTNRRGQRLCRACRRLRYQA